MVLPLRRDESVVVNSVNIHDICLNSQLINPIN